MNLNFLIQSGETALTDSLSPRLDAEVLLSFVLHEERSWLLTHPNEEVSDETTAAFNLLIERRKNGEPIAYLTGKKEFYGRSFSVSKDVLVPRPETESLIDFVKKDFVEGSILELGTGSGCIAITLALEIPHAHVTAVDLSISALNMAKKNAEQLSANIQFIESDLFSKIPAQRFSCIVANLPYLRQEDLDDTPTKKELEHEPAIALFADDNGLAVIKQAVKNAKNYLTQDGKIYLEMLPEQIDEFIHWVKAQGLTYTCEVKADLGGTKRFVVLELLAS